MFIELKFNFKIAKTCSVALRFTVATRFLASWKRNASLQSVFAYR